MALYLGNQKVSLRSGQDPTFDYGFDSNGRLVFANKNAKEINNFLNYDSSYSEILDLSNLSKMEKVAVNGTADRKMEGLKGLLVSPNAPFTGSSPQINASYTGLNKSALVSLFESVPYNVGYEKVGNPTITDGIATCPTYNDIIKANTSITYSYDSDVVFYARFKRTNLEADEPHKATIIGNSNVYGQPLLWCYKNNLCFQPFDTPIYPGFGNVHTETWYRLKVSGKNKIWTVELQKDDGALINIGSKEITSGTRTVLPLFASWYGTVNPGVILDLNETYIKVNGVPWFGPGATKNLVPGGTVVGSPTITNGIASGFSTSNYIQASKVNNHTPFEAVICVTPSKVTGITGSDGMAVAKIGDSNIYVTSGSKLQVKYSDGSNQWCTYQTVLSADTKYWVKWEYTGEMCKLSVSTDGITYSEGIEQTYTPRDRSDNVFFGRIDSAGSIYEPLSGSIDLNNTYIKVGSDYFYRGMVPMTKTCSIVGAMGTADLTQEDKNIILNKGWSLTVQ